MTTQAQRNGVIFGFPDFWPKVYAEYQTAFDTIIDDAQLATEMFNAAQEKMSQSFEKVELAVYLLVSMTAAGMQELVILVGNGAGAGARLKYLAACSSLRLWLNISAETPLKWTTS